MRSAPETFQELIAATDAVQPQYSHPYPPGHMPWLPKIGIVAHGRTEREAVANAWAAAKTELKKPGVLYIGDPWTLDKVGGAFSITARLCRLTDAENDAAHETAKLTGSYRLAVRSMTGTSDAHP